MDQKVHCPHRSNIELAF